MESPLAATEHEEGPLEGTAKKTEDVPHERSGEDHEGQGEKRAQEEENEKRLRAWNGKTR